MREKNIKKSHNFKRGRLRKKLLSALDLPVDADGDALKITMVADTDLLVENHKGVVRYTESLVRLYSEHGILRIVGQGLQLSEFAAERAYIRGSVYGWCLESKCERDFT